MSKKKAKGLFYGRNKILNKLREDWQITNMNIKLKKFLTSTYFSSDTQMFIWDEFWSLFVFFVFQMTVYAVNGGQ